MWHGRVRRLCHPGRAGHRGVRYVDFVSNKVNKNVLRAGTITAGTALMLLMSSPRLRSPATMVTTRVRV